jgi:hypothetical protein
MNPAFTGSRLDDPLPLLEAIQSSSESEGVSRGGFTQGLNPLDDMGRRLYAMRCMSIYVQIRRVHSARTPYIAVRLL